MSDDATVTKNSSAHRFEIVTDAGVATLSYHENARHITLIHTEVPPALEGKGVGSALARGALEYARNTGLRVVAHCAFVKAYLARHPEYADLTQATA